MGGFSLVGTESLGVPQQPLRLPLLATTEMRIGPCQSGLIGVKLPFEEVLCAMTRLVLTGDGSLGARSVANAGIVDPHEFCHDEWLAAILLMLRGANSFCSHKPTIDVLVNDSAGNPSRS